MVCNKFSMAQTHVGKQYDFFNWRLGIAINHIIRGD
jgi:hypothetical protein